MIIRRSTPINFRIFFMIISYYTLHSLSNEDEIKEKQPDSIRLPEFRLLNTGRQYGKSAKYTPQSQIAN
ncbi:hypothetical protein EO946_01455 [Bacillus spizizenii ATCC 6633 = JCM 2499]|nr:hypothetical protein [Bacillus spizizenii]MDR4203895.1 hypothetical protein [Bacillus spizizenii ATCC 6633 = JCM 2499]QCJ19360.1 hypothetical protein FA024_20735 [Bacillus subtilis]QCY15831.1 hypothetical protein EO946_01455 [Bacillus spizizenii ATCC 6633 = JCM 2499]QDD05316.1 hypothetical protein FIU26_16450 [Bacillus subtilis]